MDRADADNQVKRYQFNWVVAHEYAKLAGGKQVKDYQELIAATEKEFKDLAKKMSEALPALEMAAKCENGDASAQADCLAKGVADPSPLIREKSVWDISRLPKEVSGPALAKILSTDMLDTREVIVQGIYRNPDKSAIAAIDAILEKEKSKGGPHRLDRHRLKLLRSYLVGQKL